MAVVARSLSAWMGKRDKSDNCLYSSRKSHQAPNMLQKNCLCQYTYRSINCSRVSSSPIPWSLHSLSWISSVVVSPSVLVNHGMLGWVQQGASTTNTLLPIPQGIIGKKCLWMTSSIVASLTVVVSANVRRNLSSTIRIAETWASITWIS